MCAPENFYSPKHLPERHLANTAGCTQSAEPEQADVHRPPTASLSLVNSSTAPLFTAAGHPPKQGRSVDTKTQSASTVQARLTEAVCEARSDESASSC